MATPTSASTLFHTLLTNLGDDLFKDGAGLLNTFFTNVKANPTTQNVLAQGAILAASAPMQLPNLEQASIGQLADTGLELMSLVKVST